MKYKARSCSDAPCRAPRKHFVGKNISNLRDLILLPVLADGLETYKQRMEEEEEIVASLEKSQK